MWTLTIPKALRGLFQRERKLLGILSRSAHDALFETFQAALGRSGVRPGCVTSIQTFGSFGANFHPHIHMIATAGAFTEDGDFLPLPDVDAKVVEEIFRRLITRAPIRIDAIEIDDEGQARISTPPHPNNGSTELRLDPLEWIHAITSQIPDRRQHVVRYYGAYASRTRGAGRFGARRLHSMKHSEQDQEQSPEQKRSRASWARLLRRILEVDALLCPKCGIEMTVVSIITDPPVVDHILRHLASGGGCDPFEVSRAPPPP